MISHSEFIDGVPQPTEQGSRSWHEWRRQGIGGSDVAAVLGVSPWRTRLDLYMEKTGQKEGFKGNFATARGQELEPLARAMFELQVGSDFEPALMVHDEHKFMRVSLDGYNPNEGGQILEIKCPGEADHKTACEGKVPEKYMCQVQYQLYVAGAAKAYYFSFDGTEGVSVEVYPDMTMQMHIATQVKDFWENHVLALVPPRLSDKDVLEVEDDGSFKRYQELASQVAALETQLEETKASLLTRYAPLHARVRSSGVEIATIERKGSIDYNKVPNLADVDLEQYRKPSTKYHTIKLV